jgi:hypothetical protein
MQSLPYWQKDIYDRNKPWTDEELDGLIPAQGYEVSIDFQLSFVLLTKF